MTMKLWTMETECPAALYKHEKPHKTNINPTLEPITNVSHLKHKYKATVFNYTL